jgi:hypothetical protein
VSHRGAIPTSYFELKLPLRTKRQEFANAEGSVGIDSVQKQTNDSKGFGLCKANELSMPDKSGNSSYNTPLGDIFDL